MATFSPSTLPEAIELLAKRAVVMREVRQLQKQAFGFDMSQLKDYGGQAMDYMSQHPQLTGTLAGAGGGALLGGLSSLGKDPEERQTGNSMLTGALAGAGVGLGGSYLLPYLKGEQGGSLPGLDPAKQKQLDGLNQQADKLNAKNTGPSLLGTATMDSPLVAGAAGIDYAMGQHARKPVYTDLIPGKDSHVGSEGVRSEVQRYLGEIPENEKEQLLHHATGKGNAPPSLQPFLDSRQDSHANAMAQHYRELNDWHGYDGRGPRPTMPEAPAEFGQQALRNIMEEGQTARLAGKEMTPSMLKDLLANPKSLGIRGAGYLGLPLLHHYLLRKTMHEIGDLT